MKLGRDDGRIVSEPEANHESRLALVACSPSHFSHAVRCEARPGGR